MYWASLSIYIHLPSQMSDTNLTSSMESLCFLIWQGSVDHGWTDCRGPAWHLLLLLLPLLKWLWVIIVMAWCWEWYDHHLFLLFVQKIIIIEAIHFCVHIALSQLLLRFSYPLSVSCFHWSKISKIWRQADIPAAIHVCRAEAMFSGFQWGQLCVKISI